MNREEALKEIELAKKENREANLIGANLRGANLYGADLYGADLYGADLREANLREAYLGEADLRKANLYGADLRGAYLPNFQICPEFGSFIAWKKLANGVIAQLLIPQDSLRTSNLIGRKCRAEFVKVLNFYDIDGNILDIEKAYGWRDESVIYEVNKFTVADKYDDDIRIECTHGIHFFMTFKEAKEW